MLVKSALQNTLHSPAYRAAVAASLATVDEDSLSTSGLWADGNTRSEEGGISPSTESPARRVSFASDTKIVEKEIVERAITTIDENIARVEVQIITVERELEESLDAFATNNAYRGKEGAALTTMEERLVRKEGQLRDKEKQLRDEKLLLLRSFLNASPHYQAMPQKRISLIMTSPFEDNSDGQKEETLWISRIKKKIQARRASFIDRPGDAAGLDTVVTVFKQEEDPRLLERLGSLELPILVSTLLSGFTLVLFDISQTRISQQLALVSFGLEMSSGMVLCLIAFRGKQLYSYATFEEPLTRKFLRRSCAPIAVALIAFALGVIVLILGFVLDASHDLGTPWLAVVAVVFLPTVVAGGLFVASTVEVRRLSVHPPENTE